MLLGLGSRSDAAVREYAVISIKVGAGESTSINTGTLVFELWPDLAPKTVQNFKHLANTRFYDGTASHRLIPNFMIQAGDPNTRSDANVRFFGQGGPGHTIPDELAKQSDASWEKRKHVRGILSMANSNNDDPEKGEIRTNTGGSQFFVMFGSAQHLDLKHPSFGKLLDTTQNAEFLNALERVSTIGSDSTNYVYPDQPSEPIRIEAIRVFGRNDATDELFALTPTTYSGLLRSPTRSTTFGCYQFSVTRTGIVSGVVELLARRTPITTSLVLFKQPLVPTRDDQFLYALGVTPIDSPWELPSDQQLCCRVRFDTAFSTYSPANSITVDFMLFDTIKKSLSSLNDVFGFSESLSETNKGALAKQYGMRADSTQVWARNGDSWDSDLSPPLWRSDALDGKSHFLIRVNPYLGLSIVSGKLADGTPHVTSRVISSEHGANLLPLYSYSLATSSPVPRTEGDMQIRCTSLVSGAVELASKNSTTAARSRFFWVHPETTSTTAPLKKRYAVITDTFTSPWNPPTRNTVMKPFSSNSPRGQLKINGATFDFSLVKNTTAAFDQNPSQAKPFLSFNPITGAFSGIFNDTAISPARRRTFSGVLLDSTDARGGFGYYLDSTSSKSIEIIPILP